MDTRFSEDQELIRSTAAAFLQDWQSAGGFRALSDVSKSWDSSAWRSLGDELGFAGLSIPEQLGGAGLGAVERALVMEEMGRVLFMAPYFATCVLATDLLLAVQTEEANALLSQIASGGLTATVATMDSNVGETNTLNGSAFSVIDGADADIVLVKASDALLAVKSDAPGLRKTIIETLDRTRAIADLQFDDTVAETISSGSQLQAQYLIADTHSALALSAEQVGGADAMLSATVSYAMERKQFGRLIGSFQAVKHRCADMMTRIEAARSAVYLAAAMAANDDFEDYAAVAKSESSETYFKTAGDAIQMHGGVGVTWEYDMHFHFKRARAGLDLLGTPEAWRERLADRIGLGEVAA